MCVSLFLYILYFKMNHQKMTFFPLVAGYWWWNRYCILPFPIYLYKFSSVREFICVQAHCSLFIAQYAHLVTCRFIFPFMFWTIFISYEYGLSPYHSGVYLLFFVNLSLLFCIRIEFRYIAYLLNRLHEFQTRIKIGGKKRNFSRPNKMPSIQHIIIIVDCRCIVDTKCNLLLYRAIWEKTVIVINHCY